jgi:PleD family two-component response regulator
MRFPKRILLLGNELRVTQLVRQTLASTGRYLLKEEQNSRAAFQAARIFQPDVIFLGLTADALDWNNTLEQIRTDIAFRATPVFVLTISNTEDSVVYGGSLDGYEFSAQPVKIEELVRSVDELLEA